MAGSTDLLIDGYLDHLKVERGLSPQTLDCYAHDLQRLAEHLAAEDVELEQADAASVAGFLITLSQSGLSARSQARCLSAVRGFFKHLVAERHLKRDPTELVDGPRLARKLPGVLTPKEVERLLAAPDPDSPNGLRDRAMMQTMYAAGLRVSELITLELGDIDLESGFVAAFGKGRKRRIVPLGEVA
ncbi:MAG: site-specific integrase, partial [Polyangiales bacterium]